MVRPAVMAATQDAPHTMPVADQRLKLARKLAVLCLLLLVAVTCLSAYLRHSAGGLDCAPWPACFGPGERMAAGPMVIDGQALTVARTAHRITATLALLLLMALVFTSIGRRPRLRREAALSSALLALALLLALLGVFTPGSRLPAVAIGNLLGGFVMVALAARLVRAPTHRGLGAFALAVALLLLAQVVTGAFVSATRAGLACIDIRECLDQARAGGWDWAALNPWHEPGFAVGTPYAEGALAQLLHRLGGLLVAPAVAGLAMIALWRGRRREGLLLLALLVLEVALGLAVGSTGLPLVSVLWHNLVSALLLAVILRLA
jgi:cytochrome c oxidase assembly protein subunit 15